MRVLLAGRRQSLSKGAYCREALRGIFVQGGHNRLLHSHRQVWPQNTQSLRGSHSMFDRNLGIGSLKGRGATEPLIGRDSERVLIAGRAWVSSKLFWGHIDNRTRDILSIARL